MTIAEALQKLESADIDLDLIDAAECVLNHHQKYRWHDLRKNPNDLPKIDKDVLVRVIGDVTDICSRQTVAWRSVYGEHWESNVSIIDCTVISWREIEPFEVKE